MLRSANSDSQLCQRDAFGDAMPSSESCTDRVSGSISAWESSDRV